MTCLPSPALPSRRRRLAAELQRLRNWAQPTGDEVAARLGWSPTKVSRECNSAKGKKITTETLDLADAHGVTISADAGLHWPQATCIAL
jgi:helix-turn-helix protein